MASTPPADGVVKRGRGRPRKDPSQLKPKPQPSGRPRGRPKGSGGVKKSTPATPKNPSGRGRGRPRKSDAQLDAAVAGAEGSKPTPKAAKLKATDGNEKGTPRAKTSGTVPKKGGPKANRRKSGPPPPAEVVEDEDIDAEADPEILSEGEGE